MRKIYFPAIFFVCYSALFTIDFICEYSLKALENEKRIISETIAFEQVKISLIDEIVLFVESEIDETNIYRSFVDTAIDSQNQNKIIRYTVTKIIGKPEIVEQQWNKDQLTIIVRADLTIESFVTKLKQMLKSEIPSEMLKKYHKKDIVISEILRLRKKLVESVVEHEIMFFQNKYREIISQHISEFIQYLEGKGKSTVQVSDTLDHSYKIAFLTSFSKALFDIHKKLNYPVNSSGNYNIITENEHRYFPTLYQTVNTKYSGNIKDFEVTFYEFNEMLDESAKNISQEIIRLYAIVEFENYTYLMQFDQYDHDKLLYPEFRIDFPEIDKIIMVENFENNFYIGGLSIQNINFVKDDNELRCYMDIILEN